MERNVVCFKTAQRLKKAGFPQDTVFCWDISDRSDMPFASVNLMRDGVFTLIAAPTATEIYFASGMNSNCNFALPEYAAQEWLGLQEQKS